MECDSQRRPAPASASRGSQDGPHSHHRTEGETMRAIRKSLPSPAMIVACAALVIALGDVSYAAAVLPESSVGTVQLKKKAVTASKLRANSVSGTKMKDGTLTAIDFQAGQLPQGPKGDPGAQGLKGDSGAAGARAIR